MILKKDIITDDNPLLRQKSVDVALPLSKEDEALLDEMMEYLENSQDDEKAKELDIQPGVGLAAPQIGVLKKMFVVLTYDDNGKLHKYALELNEEFDELNKKQQDIADFELPDISKTDNLKSQERNKILCLHFHLHLL